MEEYDENYVGRIMDVIRPILIDASKNHMLLEVVTYSLRDIENINDIHCNPYEG